MKESIAKLVEGQDLTSVEAVETMSDVMSGKATESQIAAFLTAFRMKGGTIEEITAFASVMRQFCHHIHPKGADRLVDTCGTGGDLIKTFNISTIAAFVAAGAGIAVAKHGNRSVTSRCGSADVLESLVLNLTLAPTLVEKSIEQVGIGFLFAPTFHPTMKYASNPRREIGIRTVFNLLGPLTNPADATAQLLGVYDETLTEPLAHILAKLGVEQAMVVHGLDGLDEISTIGRTKVTSLTLQGISTTYLDPEDFGFERAEQSSLEVSTTDESAAIVVKILNGQNTQTTGLQNPKYEIVLANAAAAIVVGGKSKNLVEGIDVAKESIDSGAAYKKLRALIKFSGGDLSVLEALEKS